jgi:hypothetical protein
VEFIGWVVAMKKCRTRLLAVTVFLVATGPVAAWAAEPPVTLASLEMPAVDPHELDQARGGESPSTAKAQGSSTVAVILWDETHNRVPASYALNTASTGTVTNSLSANGTYSR